ncbi:hypothetical protein N0V86_000779 [Didymella sp. IMI 355093]|nr:hypothetical protein N0V86_000779 [Didymella sp. IMI 355093]
MVVTAIHSFTASALTDTTEQLSKAVNTIAEHPQFVIGTKVQDPTTIQITSEWPLIQAPSDLTDSTSFQAFNNTISSIASSPLTIIVASLDKSIFAAGTPPLIEFVHCSFPGSSSPEFRSKIDGDFARFESILRRRGAPEELGELGLATGWAEEKDGVRGFVVVRGWAEMEKFEEAVQTEEFKEAIPILMGWDVPFELWHIEKKSGGEGL